MRKTLNWSRTPTRLLQRASFVQVSSLNTITCSPPILALSTRNGANNLPGLTRRRALATSAGQTNENQKAASNQEVKYDTIENLRRAAEAGDSTAQFHLGRLYERGEQKDGGENTPRPEKDRIAEAMELYRKSAAQGNVHAHYILGCHLMRGGPELMADAIAHFEEGMKQNHSPSFCNMGIIYLHGLGGIKGDTKRGVELLEMAASQGHPHAMMQLGVFALHGAAAGEGEEEKRNLSKAIELFIGAAEKGDLDAVYHLASIYEESEEKTMDEEWNDVVGEDSGRSLKLFQAAADAGHPPSQTRLAELHLEGRVVERDLEKAVELLEAAAAQSFPNALCELGFLLERGHGVEKNIEKAKALFEKAAHLGHPPAQCHLGSIYFDGFGVEKNPKRAYYYYKASAKQGFPSSQYMLGVMNEMGVGVKRPNLERAFKYYRRAARRGHAKALCDVGRMYSNGLGVESDVVKAERYFRISASYDYPLAYTNLGLLKENATVTEMEGESEKEREERQQRLYRHAYKCYKEAARLGHVEGQYRLGLMLHAGKGVDKDTKAARKWMMKAAAGGDERAKKFLEMRKVANSGDGK